jgi:hypothetical protein
VAPPPAEPAPPVRVVDEPPAAAPAPPVEAPRPARPKRHANVEGSKPAKKEGAEPGSEPPSEAPSTPAELKNPFGGP